MLFRRDGKPVRGLRRSLFHNNGEPRRIFRSWIIGKDGVPRKPFKRWMESEAYLALPKAYCQYLEDQPVSVSAEGNPTASFADEPAAPLDRALADMPVSEGLRRIRAGGATPPHLPVQRWRSMDAFLQSCDNNAGVTALRRSVELHSIPDSEPFTLNGFCHMCGNWHSMLVLQDYSSEKTSDGRIIPNWRECLTCLNCGTGNRLRAAFKVLDQEYACASDARVYITEQVTPLFAMLNDRYSSLTGSEYLAPDLAGGTVKDGLRHEDVQALSFPDKSFDLVLSFDVLEHVPFRQRAFEELFRTLAPSGRLLFTVPFSHVHHEEVVRAIINERGELHHLMEPEYHGNPLDTEGGSLCFRHFGWSVIDHLKEAGFVEVEILSYWSLELLHFGNPQFIFTGRRPA